MFQGGVDSTNDDAIDLLFGAKTPGADQLVGGKKTDGDEPDAGDSGEPDVQDQGGKVIVDPNDPEGILSKISRKSSDEVADELFGADDPADPELKPQAKKVPQKKVEPAQAAVETEVDFETLYKAMVKENVFQEVEIPEGFVWDAEGFKEIQKLQVQSKYDDLLDKTGPYGKAIIDFEQKGGNPGEMLNLFREQRTIKDFDISTPEGQEEFLTSYYEAQNYSTASIDRTIKALIDQGGGVLKEEAGEKKGLWDEEYTQEIKRVQEDQELRARQMQEQLRTFNKTISDTLTGDEELSPKERKELGSYILAYTQKFNGAEVSQFYLDMTEIQKDPAAYVELAKFIKGLKTGDYKKKITDKVNREVSAKNFLKVKHGNALTQKGGGEVPLDDSNESSFVTFLSNNNKGKR